MILDKNGRRGGGVHPVLDSPRLFLEIGARAARAEKIFRISLVLPQKMLCFEEGGRVDSDSPKGVDYVI